MPLSSPHEIVDRQLAAYNARDIEAYCALFAPEAVLSRVNDGVTMARGIDAIRAHYTARFASPTLHCRILARMESGRFVIDHEQVAGIMDSLLEVIAIYEVRDLLIHSVRIISP